MPARPEFNDVPRFEGTVEIGRQTDPEQKTQTDRHIGIAGKIEIDLKRIGHRARPRRSHCGHVAHTHQRKDRPGISAHRIGDDHFLEQADQKQCDPNRPASSFAPPRHQTGELWEHLAMMRNWACNQVRKKRDKQAVVEKAVLDRRPVMGIAQICNLLKRKEGDGQWKNNMRDIPPHPGGFIKHRDQKPGIFEITKKNQVRRNADKQQDTRPAMCQHLPYRKISCDTPKKKWDSPNIPPAIEYEGGACQP